MDHYRKQVTPAINATVFHSSTSFSWFGKASRPVAKTVQRALTPKTARSYLLYQLQNQLYGDFYRQGFAGPSRRDAAELPAHGRTPFVETLSAANGGNGCWEAGWQVVAVNGAEVVVSRDGLTLWVRPQDCLAPAGGEITPGLRVSLRFPKEFLSISPGFYMVQGDEPLAGAPGSPLVRFYWHLTPEAAAPFVRSATVRLNGAGLPFRLKVLSDPSHYVRCDAGVVYVQRGDYAAVAAMLREVYHEVAAHLRPGTPALTKPLAPGVGLAEDPGQSDSFGQHRCRLLADGMIRAYEQGKTLLADRLHIVADRFAEEGIRLEEPFVNRGSGDDYEVWGIQ
jgi:hypothetical protein